MVTPTDAGSTLQAGPKLDRTARITVAVLFLAWVVDYVDRLTINLALPSIGHTFHLDRTEQGLVVSVFFVAYALCQIPGGLLADRFGAKRVIGWALLAWSLFTAVTGLAGSFTVLLLVRFVFGLAEGAFPAAAMKAVTERTPPGRRMSANGLVASSNAVATALTPLVAAPLIVAFGWRTTFVVIAAVGLIVYAVIQLWLPSRSESPAVEPREADGDTEMADAREVADAVPRPALPSTRVVLRSAVMWRFTAMFFGYDLIVWGLNTWVPTYLNDERGLSLTRAGAIALVPALASTVAAIVGGRLADRLSGRHRLVVVPAMAVTAVGVLLLTGAESMGAFVTWLTLAAVGAGLSYMPIFAVPLRSLPAELAGAGSGMIIFGGQLAGVVAPVAMGALADAFSFQAAFALLGLGALLAAVMAVTTPQSTESFLHRLAPVGFGRVPHRLSPEPPTTRPKSLDTEEQSA
ncbi:MFS transporter [Streptomyces sp. NPDC003435]